MDYRNAESEGEKIKELKYELTNDQYTLKWKWTDEFDCVYMFKTEETEYIPLEELLKLKPKVYTKDEYKGHNGFKERITELTQYRFYIYPMKEDYDNKIIINQDPEDNSIVLCTGKPYIRFYIKEKKRLFSNKKTVQIIVNPDVNIDKNVLCYVKIEGSCPTNKEEGILYQFNQDFRQGENVFPEIEIGKNEYINIFFTDGKKYGEKYNLIQM
jgi:hypothetical protein